MAGSRINLMHCVSDVDLLTEYAIISDLESGPDREIATKTIGARVMERLHAVDPVAYVRFASVYRRFEDIGEFIEEIQSLERRSPVSDDQKELFNKLT